MTSHYRVCATGRAVRECGSANIPTRKNSPSLGFPKRALVSSSAANVEMSFDDAVIVH